MKRKAVRLATIALLLLTVLYAVLVITAYRRLRRAHSAVREAGRPATVADIVPAPVRDEDNAALCYEEALVRLDAVNVEREGTALAALAALARAVVKESPTAEDVTELGYLLARTEVSEAIDLVFEGAVKPKCRFHRDYALRPGCMRRPPKVRHLSPILSAKAFMEHRQGRQERAWEMLYAALRLANCLESEPLFLSQMVRIGQLSITVRALELMSRLSLPSDQQFDRTIAGLAAFDEVGSLTLSLDGMRLLDGEWFFTTAEEQPDDILQALGLLEIGAPVRSRLYRFCAPLRRIDHAIYIENVLALTAEAARLYAEPGQASSPAPSVVAPPYCVMTQTLLPHLHSWRTRYGKLLATSRLGRIGLVLARRRAQTGKAPADLAEVGAELPGDVFVDPFTGRSFLYRVTENAAVLYSVGKDGEDDGGARWPSRVGGSHDIVWRL